MKCQERREQDGQQQPGCHVGAQPPSLWGRDGQNERQHGETPQAAGGRGALPHRERAELRYGQRFPTCKISACRSSFWDFKTYLPVSGVLPQSLQEKVPAMMGCETGLLSPTHDEVEEIDLNSGIKKRSRRSFGGETVTEKYLFGFFW